jgi:hypothetical protein
VRLARREDWIRTGNHKPLNGTYATIIECQLQIIIHPDTNAPKAGRPLDHRDISKVM